MISYKDKYLFIHIPRTGGTSIEDYLYLNTSAASELPQDVAIRQDLLRYQHIHVAVVREILLEKNVDLADFFKFTFIRNPWERLVSFYYYDHYTNIKIGKERNINNFRDYVRHKISKKPFNILPYKTPYKRSELLYGTMGSIPLRAKCRGLTDNFWIFDDNDNMLMDFVGRFENLQNDFDIVCDKLKIPRGTLKKLRACGDDDSCPWHKERGISIPKYEHYTKYYDDETLEIVNCLVQKDADYFGYKFGE